MNYSKPEITSLASASFVIQGTEKGPGGADLQNQPEHTIAAYEADE